MLVVSVFFLRTIEWGLFLSQIQNTKLPFEVVSCLSHKYKFSAGTKLREYGRGGQLTPQAPAGVGKCY